MGLRSATCFFFYKLDFRAKYHWIQCAPVLSLSSHGVSPSENRRTRIRILPGSWRYLSTSADKESTIYGRAEAITASVPNLFCQEQVNSETGRLQDSPFSPGKPFKFSLRSDWLSSVPNQSEIRSKLHSAFDCCDTWLLRNAQKLKFISTDSKKRMTLIVNSTGSMTMMSMKILDLGQAPDLPFPNFCVTELLFRVQDVHL